MLTIDQIYSSFAAELGVMSIIVDNTTDYFIYYGHYETYYETTDTNEMIPIEISQDVWDAIAAEGKFGEIPDDVLRRKYDLPATDAGLALHRPTHIPPPSTNKQELYASGAGGQNATTGRRAAKRGVSEAARAAEYLGAEKAADGTGNEYILNGERLLFKWASYKNARLGIYDPHMERVDFVIGVLETAYGNRELWKATPEAIAPYMQRATSEKIPTQKQLNKEILRQHGKLIATLNSEAAE